MPGKRVTFTVTNQVAQSINTAALGFIPGSLFMTVELADVRVAWDGTPPSADEGHIVFNGSTFSLSKPSQIMDLKIIARTVTDAKVTITIGGT